MKKIEGRRKIDDRFARTMDDREASARQAQNMFRTPALVVFVLRASSLVPSSLAPRPSSVILQP